MHRIVIIFGVCGLLGCGSSGESVETPENDTVTPIADTLEPSDADAALPEEDATEPAKTVV